MDESHTRMERISSRKNIRIVTRFSWVFFQRSLNALLTESMAYVDNITSVSPFPFFNEVAYCSIIKYYMYPISGKSILSCIDNHRQEIGYCQKDRHPITSTIKV